MVARSPPVPGRRPLATARPRSLPGLGCCPAAPRSRSPLPMTDQEHQPPLLCGKPGSPTTPPQRFSGQGLLLCLGPCPHFGLPGTSNGQGPHHEIRPCPLASLRAPAPLAPFAPFAPFAPSHPGSPHPATPSTAQPRQRCGVNRKVLCVRRLCKTTYVILHRRFYIND